MAADTLFLEYPKCSTCQKAKKWLDAHDVAYTDRHIVEDNPTAEELRVARAERAAPEALLQHERHALPRDGAVEEAARHARRRAIRPARHQRHARKAPLLITAATVIPGFKNRLGRGAGGLVQRRNCGLNRRHLR